MIWRFFILLATLAALEVTATPTPTRKYIRNPDAIPDKASQFQKRTLNWASYMAIASAAGSIRDQNNLIKTLPGNRAICPSEIAALETCHAAIPTTNCMDQRWNFELCFNQRLSECYSSYYVMTLACHGMNPTDCELELGYLEECATAIPVTATALAVNPPS